MSHETVERKVKNFKEIEEIISKAIKKVGAKKESDLCRYLPGEGGGYIHHFTLKKLKGKKPEELVALLEKFVIGPDRPGKLPHKPRAARGSRKRYAHQIFTRSILEKIVAAATAAGDKEIVDLLAPKMSFAAYKKRLLSSIRHNRVEVELWNGYVEALNAQQETSGAV